MRTAQFPRLFVSATLGASSFFAAAISRGQISSQLITTGLASPLFVTAAPGDANHLFIVEQGSSGNADIKVLTLGTNVVSATPFFTISGIATGGEQGLLGLAFDPNYATNGKFYVDYTATGGAFNAGVTHITQYTRAGDSTSLQADLSTAHDILTITQPQTNHNGGWLGFSNRTGDSGNLYIAMGDGGGGDDTGAGHNATIGNGQDTTSLLGKILRITPTVAGGPAGHPNYTIPSNNPFAVSGGAPEVFDYGLRNPFRDSFDRANGNFFIGDVGQSTREEVDLQQSAGGGENYGWRTLEGRTQNPTYNGIQAPANAVAPIYDYTHSSVGGQVEIGGYVYRGSRVPSLFGKYIFGDEEGPLDSTNNPGNNHAQIFEINGDGSSTQIDAATNLTALLTPPGGQLFNITSFGEDSAGELYFLDAGAGKLFEIVPEPASASIVVGICAAWGPLNRKRRRRAIERA